MDTICLEKSAGRTTPEDERIVRAIEELKHVDDSQRRQIFNELNQRKQDVSGRIGLYKYCVVYSLLYLFNCGKYFCN